MFTHESIDAMPGGLNASPTQAGMDLLGAFSYEWRGFYNVQNFR